MYMLTKVEDSLRLDPSQMGMPTALALEEQIKKLYFDTVLHKVGLVVTLYDINSIEGGDVQNGDGGTWFTAQFNLVIFRPFEAEVMLGRIHKSTEHGITLDLGVMKDAFIPERYMQTPGSMFDASKQMWFWKYEGDVLWLNQNEVIRFKVREVFFRDSQQKPKSGEEGYPSGPMVVIADIDGDGLGCLSWWDSTEE